MSELESWLKQATRHLSKDSAAQVRTEIREHYESALEAALSGGANASEADRAAVAALGDARAANRQYRNVLLTSAEARALRDARREGRVFCSRPALKWLLRAMPVAALIIAAALFVTGPIEMARVLLVGGIGMGVLFSASFLPVYTRRRGLVFRCVKWILLLAIFWFALGWSWVWLSLSCLWPLAWTEWRRMTLRRKLPAAEWPRQLYL